MLGFAGSGILCFLLYHQRLCAQKCVYIIPFMNIFILVLQFLPDVSVLCDDSGLVRKILAWLGLSDLVYSLISSVAFVSGSPVS